MSDLKEKVKGLNLLIQQFKYPEALDLFYDENIITQENEETPIKGLAAYREAGKKFMDAISNYSAEVKSIIISDDMSVVEWHYQFDHTMAGKWDRLQISVQRWKDGKIIHERHHWNPYSISYSFSTQSKA